MSEVMVRDQEKRRFPPPPEDPRDTPAAPGRPIVRGKPPERDWGPDWEADGEVEDGN